MRSANGELNEKDYLLGVEILDYLDIRVEETKIDFVIFELLVLFCWTRRF